MTAFLIGLAIAFGLVGTDAYLNSNTLYLNASISKNLIDKGYSEDVVVARIVSHIQNMSESRNPSLVRPPIFHSSSVKSFAILLAESLKVEKAMIALQDLLAYVPPRMQLVVVGKGEDVRIHVSGYSEDSGMLVVSVDGSLDDMEALFHRLAKRIIIKVDSYTGMLQQVAGHSGDGGYGEVKEWFADAVRALPATPRSEERAYLENLRGIVALLDDDETAEAFFRRSTRSKPDFAIAWLNLAFTLAHQGKYQEAIDIAERVTRSWWREWTDNPELLSSAKNLIGMARWRLGDDAGAYAAFRKALKLNPKSAEPYVYWGRVLADLGQSEAAARMFEAGRRNAAEFDNHPEVAMLYFWFPDEPGTKLVPRAGLDVTGKILAMELNRGG